MFFIKKVKFLLVWILKIQTEICLFLRQKFWELSENQASFEHEWISRDWAVVPELTKLEMKYRDRILMQLFGFLPRWIKPNHITLTRFFSSWALLWPDLPSTKATFIALFSALGDALDGTLARTRNHITRFGIFFDPIADRFFEVAIIWYLITKEILQLGILYQLLLPEMFVLIFGIWSLLTKSKLRPTPNVFGRIKCFLYGCSLLLLMISDWASGGKFFLILGTCSIKTGIIFSWVSLLFYLEWIYWETKKRRLISDLILYLS